MQALVFRGVALRLGHSEVLRDIDWRVDVGERWVVLGPNGSGKTSMLSIAGARAHPTRGDASVLGSRLGDVDVRELRKRIGLVSGAMLRIIRPQSNVFDVVLSGKNAALETWWDEYDEEDHNHALSLMREFGIDDLSQHPFSSASDGERQQVLLARLMMGRPELLLLDEPFAGLDLGARERLVTRLSSIACDSTMPPLVLVTHHTEEIPRGTTHVALMRAGTFVVRGPIEEVMCSSNISLAFETAIAVEHRDGRWWSRAIG